MKRFLVYSLLAALTSASLQSCLKSNEVDSVQVANDNDAAIKQYVTQNSGTTSYSASPNNTGLYYAMLKANPGGKKPSTGEEVMFAYTLYDLNNKALDSSKVGSLPFFVYGLNSLLPGLQEGLSLIREGEKARFLLPSYLAYGSQAQTAFNLPANSPVRFDIELVRSRNEEQQISDYVASPTLATSLSATTPLNVVRSTSGLRLIKTLSKPTGASITAGQSVTVNYSGQTLRATAPFDKSSDGSFGFTLGRNQLIAGFEEGVLQMRIGEKATVVFPSSIGYGTSGQRNASGVYVILPYSPLRFDIEVVNAK